MKINLMHVSRTDLIIALRESVKLQSHYADLLNLSDGGSRLQFNSAEDWVKRLMDCDTIRKDKRLFTQSYHREASYTPDEIFPYVGPGDKIFRDKIVDMNSLRYHTFKKSLICASCGLEGTIFWLEKNLAEKNSDPNRYHFNLYGIRDEFEVLFTKDHINPRSKGGKNHISNLQTMCTDYNLKKGNTI